MIRKTTPRAKSAAVLTLMVAALLLGLTATTGCDVRDVTGWVLDPLKIFSGGDGALTKADQRSGINMYGWGWHCWYWYWC